MWVAFHSGFGREEDLITKGCTVVVSETFDAGGARVVGEQDQLESLTDFRGTKRYCHLLVSHGNRQTAVFPVRRETHLQIISLQPGFASARGRCRNKPPLRSEALLGEHRSAARSR